jgi:hypothetical protein
VGGEHEWFDKCGLLDVTLPNRVAQPCCPNSVAQTAWWGANCMAVTTEADPTPLVLMLANTVRRAGAANPKLIDTMRGVAAVCSADDAQAVTLRFDRGDVHLTHGQAADVGVTITLDLANDGLPGAPKPKVSGALRHLRFALALDKALDPTLPTWQVACEEFWRLTSDRPSMPSALRVRDESGAELTVGDQASEPLEIHGTADRLAKMFVGMAFLLEEAQQGRMHVRGSMAESVAITAAGLDLALASS